MVGTSVKERLRLANEIIPLEDNVVPAHEEARDEPRVNSSEEVDPYQDLAQQLLELKRELKEIR